MTRTKLSSTSAVKTTGVVVGAILTKVTLILSTSVSIKVPPTPVLPKSLVISVIAAPPL